jgi:hypothetical protein
MTAPEHLASARGFSARIVVYPGVMHFVAGSGWAFVEVGYDI